MTTSIVTDDSTWRLRCGSSQIPFRILRVEGSFEHNTGGVTLGILLQSDKLVPFLKAIFPDNIQAGNISVPQYAALPGLPGMLAKSVSFRSQDQGKPIDPFGFDTAAVDGTYNNLIEVDVTFAPKTSQNPDPNDPSTFTELDGSGSGSFINSTAPKAKWQKKILNPGGLNPIYDPDDKEPVKDAKDPAPGIDGVVEVNRDPSLQVMIVAPETEWSVKWNLIPHDYFENTLIHRIHWCLGRVNGEVFPRIFNAQPETILFKDWSYSEVYSWRDDDVQTGNTYTIQGPRTPFGGTQVTQLFQRKPPVNVVFKFVEKRIVWDGMIKGHNDFWRPGVGWEYMIPRGKSQTEVDAQDAADLLSWQIAGSNPATKPIPKGPNGVGTYEKRDLNSLFRV